MYTWKEIVDHIIHHLKREAHEAGRGVMQWEEVERKVMANFGHAR
jgi:hypothetical protein